MGNCISKKINDLIGEYHETSRAIKQHSLYNTLLNFNTNSFRKYRDVSLAHYIKEYGSIESMLSTIINGGHIVFKSIEDEQYYVMECYFAIARDFNNENDFSEENLKNYIKRLNMVLEIFNKYSKM